MFRAAPALLALCLASTQAFALAPVSSCTRDADRMAFDTEGLKSELMVTALTCKRQDAYNSFMRTYLPALAAGEKDLHAYFKRVYGKQYTKAYDDYISSLANVQEQDALKAGTGFCDAASPVFDEVLALHDSTELPDFAHSQAIVQPVAFTTCAAEPVKLTRASTHGVRHRSTHKKT